MSGGFHPFHAGHTSLYQQAKEAFPDATVLVCATNVQSDRPFPFSLKKKLAQLSGVPPKDFIEVSRQFSAEDPALASRIGDLNDAVVIFVRSDKDKNDQPQGLPLNPKTDQIPLATRGPNKGKPQKLLDYKVNENNLLPASQHTYMAYLKTVEFGPGITSASEIRKAWPTLNDKRKMAMVMSLYPATQKNPKLAKNVVGMFDEVMGSQVAEVITEWQEADLYHVTSIPSMLRMWHTDNIGLGGNVSTTRNYNYALGYLKANGGRGPGGVIFTLDQDLLRRDIGRRRMPGTDWFSTRFHGGAPEDASDEFQRRRDDLDTDRFETLIKGGLSPFRKYVKKIEIWLPKDRTLKPIPPGEDPMYRNHYTPGDDPDKHYDVKLYGRLMKNNWLKDPVMRATWFAIRRDPRTEVKQELGYQKRHHGVPVDDRRQYDTNHPMYDPSRAIDEQGMAKESVYESLDYLEEK